MQIPPVCTEIGLRDFSKTASLIDRAHEQTVEFLDGRVTRLARTTGHQERKERYVETLQCPRCVLRFNHSSELRDHLAREHPAFRSKATTPEDDLLEACHCHHGHPAPRPARGGPVDNAA